MDDVKRKRRRLDVARTEGAGDENKADVGMEDMDNDDSNDGDDELF